MGRNDDILKMVNESVSLMRRMGENIDSGTYALYENNFYPPFLIREGLILSYPTDAVVSFISKAFNFKYEDHEQLMDIFGKKPNYNGKIEIENTFSGGERIIIDVEGKIDQDKLDFYMNKYGWFLSRVDDTRLYYEKKYDEYATVFQLIANDINEVYHVTEGKNLNGIRKRGLKAISQKNPAGYMHDERVYVFLNEPDEYDKMISMGSDLVVLKINLNKLPKTIRFYRDPRKTNALYTYEPIPADAIEFPTD